MPPPQKKIFHKATLSRKSPKVLREIFFACSTGCEHPRPKRKKKGTLRRDFSGAVFNLFSLKKATLRIPARKNKQKGHDLSATFFLSPEVTVYGKSAGLRPPPPSFPCLIPFPSKVAGRKGRGKRRRGKVKGGKTFAESREGGRNRKEG